MVRRNNNNPVCFLPRTVLLWSFFYLTNKLLTLNKRNVYLHCWLTKFSCFCLSRWAMQEGRTWGGPNENGFEITATCTPYLALLRLASEKIVIDFFRTIASDLVCGWRNVLTQVWNCLFQIFPHVLWIPEPSVICHWCFRQLVAEIRFGCVHNF